MADYQTPRGTRDLNPEDMRAFNWIASKTRPVVDRHGFQPVETPAFESFDLLAAKSGADIEEEIFAFTDKSDRKMGLRFDGTVPIARIVANNPALSKPIRYYYMSRYWRYDRPQAGRYREFWQLGVELIGSERIEADAEVISCAADCIKALGLKDFKIKLNDRRLFDPLVEGLNHLNICRIIDKMDKKSPEKIRGMLKKEAADKTDDIMDLCSLKGSPDRILDAAEELLGEMDAIKDLRELNEFLNKIGLGNNLEVDLSIVRGLDYYTSTVFEVKEPGYGLTLVGGGRYDDLIGVYSGKETPATGWAMGIDRMIEVLNQKQIIPKSELKVKAAVTHIKMEKEAFEITQRLRNAGIPSIMELRGRNLSNSLEWAAKNAKYAVIVGERDMKKGQVTIRNLKTGNEWKSKVSQVSSQLKLGK